MRERRAHDYISITVDRLQRPYFNTTTLERFAENITSSDPCHPLKVEAEHLSRLIKQAPGLRDYICPLILSYLRLRARTYTLGIDPDAPFAN